MKNSPATEKDKAVIRWIAGTYVMQTSWTRLSSLSERALGLIPPNRSEGTIPIIDPVARQRFQIAERFPPRSVTVELSTFRCGIVEAVEASLIRRGLPKIGNGAVGTVERSVEPAERERRWDSR